ncbi:permease [Aeromonas hydrophila]|uniref:permease n=1 Tax=Aeromonas hydrophila TaxID=644 RepID=UPI00398A1571
MRPHQLFLAAQTALTQAPVIPTAFAKARIDAWQQFKDVLPYLLLGVLIGSFIYGFIPAEWIAAHAGADNPLAIPFSAVVGIPLYIRAEAVIPLASVLLGKGMGMGAVMALIIGSAGASLTEVILLKSMFRTPMIAAFLTVILGMAVMMGYLTQWLL